MLPTEPQTKLDKIDLSPAEPSNPKTVQQFPIVLLKIASRSLVTTGHFIAKNPFWILLIGSLGIHAGLAIFTPNPLKKTPPEEILVSTPVIRLPPKNQVINSKPLSQSNKSALDNLFVKPLNDQNTTTLDSPLQRLESDDTYEANRAIRDSPEDTYTSADVPQDTYEPKPAKTPKPQRDRITADGKIDNTDSNPPSDRNIKPELRNNGIKDDQSSPSPQDNSISKQPKVSSTATSNGKELAVDNVATIYTTNGRILELLAKNSLKTTQIAPQEANIPNPDQNREKEVAWIAPKTTDFAGKTGSVVFMWLVKPDGEVEAVFVKPSGYKELDDVVREAVKDYKFKPIDPSQKDMYRLVTAKYDFPPK